MSLKGKKILVIGGAGFIGSHIVSTLLQKGANISIYDDFSSGTLDNLKGVEKDIKIVKGNILDFDRLDIAVKGQDMVSHQAAHLEIVASVKNPVDDLKNNTIGSLNVLESARKNEIEKLIIASSACVYGQAQYSPQDEKHPTRPNWEYGVSKLAVEKYSDVFVDRYGMDIKNLRYSIVYGPREWYGRVLTLFLKRAMEGKPLIIFGDGKQERDFIFVEDLVTMHNSLLEQDVEKGAVFNVSTGIGTSVTKLANLIKEMTGKNLEIIYEDVKEGETSKYFDRVRLPSELKSMVLDNKKAKNTLDWSLQVLFEEGLRREYEWLLENKNRWKKISI